MRVGSGPDDSYCDATIRLDLHCVYLETLKHKLSPLRNLNFQDEASYPSPPMSNPSSPPRPPEEEQTLNSPIATAPQSPATSVSTAPSALMPGVTAIASTFGRPFYEPVSLPALTSATPPTHPQPTTLVEVVPRTQQDVSTGLAASPLTTLSTTARAISRGGRKSKAHVASACVNCKRAHLSCDISRPCARCVASGKQDTCFDVQHKKRGRPRLREEGEFKVQQMIPESRTSTAIAAGGSEPSPSPRSIATPRHRRTESYRSLRSQGSDASSIAPSPTYSYAPPPTATQPSFASQPPPAAQDAGSSFEIPTAYLDMDLTIIKANTPYRQVMLGGQDVAGRRLDDIAVAVDGESFQSIRDRLRSERRSRDPAYMPPLHRPGDDPLQGVVEADVERYTQAFEDRTFTWTQKVGSASSQNFPARVRLAKAHTYFVAITLPSFRPIQQIVASGPQPLFASISQPPSAIGSHIRTPTPYRSPARQLATQSAPPPTGYAPYPATQAFSAPQPSSIVQQFSARTTPLPTYPLPPYQQQQPPLPPPPTFQALSSPVAGGTPRLPVAEPPTETTAFTPRSTPRELSQPAASPAGPQLPPIITTATAGRATGPFLPALAGPSSTPASEVTVSEQGEEASGSEGTPRKRRRMGIDDVLQRE